MIPTLVIGRAGSTGYPEKNIQPIFGRPMMQYPILAAQNSKLSDPEHLYLSTDCDKMKELGKSFGCKLLDRPDYLATNEALAEDAFRHGFEAINEMVGEEVEMIVLLFCNGVTITPGIIDQGIEAMRADESLDCASTVSCYNMWSPLRAKRINEDGLIEPFIEENFWQEVSCDRGSQGDVFFADCSAFVSRPRCMVEGYGYMPFGWMGKKVFPLKQWGGLDVDYKWQEGQAKFWLSEHGFSDDKTPYC